MSEEPSSAPESEPSNPWYLRPFFGRRPVVPRDARQVLRLVALGMFFENYDMGLMNAALPQITRDLGIAAEDTGFYLGTIRIAGVGTFLLLPLADRMGRRRIFLVSFVGMSVGALVTALVQTPVQYAVAQILARVFMLMASALALVIVAEEFPAGHRGAGLGLLSLLGGLGFGLCSILYAAVNHLPYGWRALYVIGFVPMFMLPFFRRSLKETRRFTASRDDATAAGEAVPSWRDAMGNWIGPMHQLMRAKPRRTLAIATIAFFGAVGGIGVFQYTSYHAQEVHGWSPGDYAMMILLTGPLPIMGMAIGGRGSDRLGRRPVGFIALLVAPGFAFLYYTGPSVLLPLAWACFVMCTSAADVILRALAVELAPTSHRGTSAGWMLLLQTFGWMIGLFLLSAFSASLEDLGPVISMISLLLVLAGFALLTVPETRGQELESISEG